MGMIQEFKDFINKGNVIDLAVGLILAGAFGKVVSAFVDGVLMPLIGKALGGVYFSNLSYKLQDAVPEVLNTDGSVLTEAVAEVAIKYGAFIQTVIDFVIIAFVVFLVVKAYNSAKKKEEEAPAAPPANEVLLAEIRDLLKK